MSRPREPILILGAGINGAAIAREFLLHGVGIYLVDAADLASGTTAYSSRLIHGGLRYLEFGEFSLVRESLAERRRLLQLAPQFVRPLRLYIPTNSLTGGLVPAASRILRLPSLQHRRSARGLWLVQLGLWLYDLIARTQGAERRSTHALSDPHVPQVDPRRFRWLCSYLDAQVEYPERLVVAMLRDCQLLAAQQQVPFRVFTYCQAVRRGDQIELTDAAGDIAAQWRPSAVVNATGAWVDRTLQKINVKSPRLIGGTKGSHVLTFHRPLRQALGAQGVYVEAADGRPVFVLPLGSATLIGTTDIVYEAPPETAVASEGEVDYLLSTANAIFPQIGLTRDDVHLHYCGIRPLPFAADAQTGAITRRHAVHEHQQSELPTYSIVGGKLTTCRSLAEETVQRVLGTSVQVTPSDSRRRPLPGAKGFPSDPAHVARELQRLAEVLQTTTAQVEAVWKLCGTETAARLGGGPQSTDASLDGTHLPLGFVRQVIRDEWVTGLSDLVERRLMLLYDRKLTSRALRQLAELLVEAGRLGPEQIDDEVGKCRERLAVHFGKRLDEE